MTEYAAIPVQTGQRLMELLRERAGARSPVPSIPGLSEESAAQTLYVVRLLQPMAALAPPESGNVNVVERYAQLWRIGDALPNEPLNLVPVFKYGESGNGSFGNDIREVKVFNVFETDIPAGFCLAAKLTTGYFVIIASMGVEESSGPVFDPFTYGLCPCACIEDGNITVDSNGESLLISPSQCVSLPELTWDQDYGKSVLPSGEYCALWNGTSWYLDIGPFIVVYDQDGNEVTDQATLDAYIRLDTDFTTGSSSFLRICLEGGAIDPAFGSSNGASLPFDEDGAWSLGFNDGQNMGNIDGASGSLTNSDGDAFLGGVLSGSSSGFNDPGSYLGASGGGDWSQYYSAGYGAGYWISWSTQISGVSNYLSGEIVNYSGVSGFSGVIGSGLSGP